MTAPFRILVTGSRHCTDEQGLYVEDVLTRTAAPVLAASIRVIVVHGKCPKGGVDLVAHRWAEATDGATPEPVEADWARYGRRAGPIRNSWMVERRANICLGFPAADSVGSWDGLKQAARAGIRGEVWPLR